MMKRLYFILFILSSFLYGTGIESNKYFGKTIITDLNVSDLKPGMYEFYFKNIENSLGNPYLIPITVFKGESGDKKFLINSGIHGNELNSILTSYEVKNYLKDKKINGVITIIHGLNTPGLLNDTRGFKFSGITYGAKDLNREINANKTSSADELYATNLWNKVLVNNADMVIDLHTQGKGYSFPLFVYGDFRNPIIVEMIKLLDADIVKMDNGEKGSIETSFVELGIPAITFELGNGDMVQPEIAKRATKGVIKNLMHFKFIKDDNIDINSTKTFFGNRWISINAKSGGYVEPHKNLLDKVKKGDLLFTQYDRFGNKINEYYSPVDGILTSKKLYPYSEVEDELAQVIYYDPKNKDQILK